MDFRQNLAISRHVTDRIAVHFLDEVEGTSDSHGFVL